MSKFQDSLPMYTSTGRKEVECFARIRKTLAITRSIADPDRAVITDTLSGLCLPASFPEVEMARSCAELILEAVPDWLNFVQRLLKHQAEAEIEMICRLILSQGGRLEPSGLDEARGGRDALESALKAEGLA